MDNDLVVVQVSEFPVKVQLSSETLMQKVKWLRASFDCFKATSAPPATQQWKKGNVATSHRPVIGTKELSCEAMTKKTMFSLMNKLTQTNKDHIVQQLKATLRVQCADMYVSTVWEFMILCPDHQNLYCDVLLQLSCYMDVRSYISNLWSQFISQPEWKCTSSGDEGYEDFCEHVKWKKQTISKIKGYGIFVKKLLLSQESLSEFGDTLTAYINDVITHNEKGTDMYVEFLISLVANSGYAYKHTRLLNTVCCWKDVATNFLPSLKFKVYDLCELVHKKFETKQ